MAIWKGQRGLSGSNVGYIGIDCVCGEKFGYEIPPSDDPNGVVMSQMKFFCGREHFVTVFAMSTPDPVNNAEEDKNSDAR